MENKNKTDERLVKIWSVQISKDKGEKGVYIVGLDKYENVHTIIHYYETGKISLEASMPSEKLEKIYRVKEKAGKLSIVGQNKAGDLFHIIHKSDNGDIISDDKLF